MAKPRPAVPRTLRKETISRRAAQAEAERELLLLAATAVFGNRGYHEASMREIATQAGFSVGALYQRFDSKDALYCEVVRKHFAAMWTVLDRIHEQHLAFMPLLLALTRAIFDHYAVHRSFLRLYGIHPPTVAEPYQSRISEMQSQERSRRALVDTFNQGQRDGLVAVDDAEFLSSMYVGMITRAATDYLSNRRPLPEPEHLVSLFLKGAGSPLEGSSPEPTPLQSAGVRRPARTPSPAARKRKTSRRVRSRKPDRGR